MTKKILFQIDSDPFASSFDSVVAVDAGVDHLIPIANVQPASVRSLTHGAIFTRGPDQLKHTAIFVGGSDVNLGEELADGIRKSFFGPMQVSVMLDPNGANSTAAAAVLSLQKHIDVKDSRVLVLAGTGPVGSRVSRLVAGLGGSVMLSSRSSTRAAEASDSINRRELSGSVSPVGLDNPDAYQSSLMAANAVVSCGAAGYVLLSTDELKKMTNCKVAIDLNAVPPLGISGIESTDKAVPRGQRIDYGAIGVGGLKMKIHRQSIRQLFSANNQFLDAEQQFEIGLTLS